MKFRDKLQRFMYGRYGPDNLYNFLFGLYLFIIVINLFVNSRILLLIEPLIVFIMFYRFFSKKIYKRSKENQIYLKIKRKILKPFKNIKRNFSDSEHIYKKCHKCKTTLKLPLPYKRGIKHAKCPSCKSRVTIFSFRRQKAELIKN